MYVKLNVLRLLLGKRSSFFDCRRVFCYLLVWVVVKSFLALDLSYIKLCISTLKSKGY